MASTVVQDADGDDFPPLSTGDAQEGLAHPVVTGTSTFWGPRCGCGGLAVSSAMLMAAAVVVVVTLHMAHTTASREGAHPRELHELAVATLQRFSKVRRLQPSRSAETFPKPILKYQSVDEHGKPGVFLGRMDEAGSIVASHVELNATQMTFIVGPEVEGVGPLVRGYLTVRDDCAYGMCGTIRAGFVNIHSTLSGTWQTEGENLDSVIHIRWIEPEMHVDQKLTWHPDEEGGQANPANTTDDDQDAQNP